SREARMAEEIIGTYCRSYASTGDGTIFEDVKPMMVQIDSNEGGKRLQKRLAFLLGLKSEERAVWIDLQQRLDAADPLDQEAQTKKEREVYKKAAAALEEVTAMAAKLGDFEHACDFRYRLGRCHEGLSQYEAVVADYKKAMVESDAAGFVQGQAY